MKFLGVFI